MSTKYPGGLITKTPVTPTGPYQNGTAPGVWTVDQALQYTKQGIWPTAGNQDPANLYIEYLFQTYLYTGNGSTQTITNGINLSGKGGLVWLKERSPNTADHNLVDTVRGVTSLLFSNLSNAAQIGGSPLDSFSSTGFVTNANGNSTNSLYATWTFREQPKFFDIVTYTGNGLSSQVISHNLGSVPGCIIVKNLTSGARDWEVFHRSLGATKSIQLNLTSAATTSIDYWNNTAPTSTQFTVGGNNTVNTDTHNYVAYLFAHDAGGFGASGTENVISCGGFTHAGANAVQTLGYEPQFLLIKKVNDVGDWKIVDTMRGWSVAGPDLNLYPNTSGAEVDSGMYNPVATGFDWGQNGTFIYIAIRRGPMQIPTVGTTVYNAVTRTGNGSATTVTGVGFTPDTVFSKTRTPAGNNPSGMAFDRLRGINKTLTLEAAGTEATNTILSAFTMNGYSFLAGGNDPNLNTYTYCDWNFKRAPSFFDEVCYTGTGATTTVTHNLAATPELIIVKSRNQPYAWETYSVTFGIDAYLRLNTDAAVGTGVSGFWGSSNPTSTTFGLGTYANNNGSGTTYVAYLFATCAGVSKVGSYTGTGALQTINCGFTTGARWVMIKRTDDIGDWYVWDSTRGIIPSNDPYLRINSSAAEVTGTDYVDTTAVGFDVTSAASGTINASSATYIFLAIA